MSPTTEPPGDRSQPSRREFLRIGLLGAISSLVAACSQAAPAPAPAPTTAPAKPTAPPAAAPTAAAKPAAAASPGAAASVPSPSAAPAVAAASPSPSTVAAAQGGTTAPGGQAALDQFVTAANAEGHIVVAGPSPDVYAAALQKFTQAYPKITMDFTPGGGGSVHFPKIDAERRGGQFNWDVLVGGGGTMFGSFEPAGYLDPLKPVLVLPDIVDDQNWIAGFTFGWVDNAKQYVYAFEGTIAPVVWVDRDAVPTSQLANFDQLLDPSWKGKIIMQDPRGAGSGSGAFGFMYATKGKDFCTKFLQQEPTIVNEQAQVAEALARGTFHVAVGMEVGDIVPYQQQGIGKNIGGLDLTGAGGRMSSGWGNLALLSKAPHPNAQKVFANWLLGKDGQTIWVHATDKNTSRRKDAPVPEGFTPPNPQNQWTDDEAHFSSENDAKALAGQLLK